MRLINWQFRKLNNAQKIKTVNWYDWFYTDERNLRLFLLNQDQEHDITEKHPDEYIYPDIDDAETVFIMMSGGTKFETGEQLEKCVHMKIE